MASAVAVLAFAAAPAMADGTSNVAAGTCVGAAGGGHDCVAALGHISASVVGTLSVNEMRAISFGNFAVTTAGTGDATIVMNKFGVRTVADAGTDKVTLLYGANNGGFNGGPGTSMDSGGQQPGHYTVSGATEGTTPNTQVYVSFQDGAGNPVDIAGDHYYPATPTFTANPPTSGAIILSNTGAVNVFAVDSFTFNEDGHDVYGHYIDSDGTVGAPGIANPNNPAGGQFAAHTAGVADVVVGATLHTVKSAAYAAGKYTGTFNIMVNY